MHVLLNILYIFNAYIFQIIYTFSPGLWDHFQSQVTKPKGTEGTIQENEAIKQLYNILKTFSISHHLIFTSGRLLFSYQQIRIVHPHMPLFSVILFFSMKLYLLLQKHFLEKINADIELCKFNNIGLGFFFSFWPHRTACGILVPNQGSNLCPLQRKRGVFTTRPPGMSLGFFIDV